MRDLHVCDLTKPLEKGTQLVFGNIARKTADEDSGIVRVCELIHGLGLVVKPKCRLAHLSIPPLTPHLWATYTTAMHRSHATAARLVFRCSRGDAHRSVAAVYTLHFR